jgi:hypothetical protein
MKSPLHVVHSVYGMFIKLTNDQGNITVIPKILSSELPYHSHYQFEGINIFVRRL